MTADVIMFFKRISRRVCGAVRKIHRAHRIWLVFSHFLQSYLYKLKIIRTKYKDCNSCMQRAQYRISAPQRWIAKLFVDIFSWRSEEFFVFTVQLMTGELCFLWIIRQAGSDLIARQDSFGFFGRHLCSQCSSIVQNRRRGESPAAQRVSNTRTRPVLRIKT